MATLTEQTAVMDNRLHTLALMVDDLPSVDADWPTMTAAERASWSLDWDQEMGSLEVVLAPAYRTGRMNKVQSARYQAVWGRLTEAEPTIRRLGLSLTKVLAPN